MEGAEQRGEGGAVEAHQHHVVAGCGDLVRVRVTVRVRVMVRVRASVRVRLGLGLGWWR